MKKKIFSLIMAVSMMSTFALGASAQGKVTYDSRAKDFIFEPGSSYSPTDLFENFKDVMPGDKIEDVIVVTNSRSGRKTVKFYMRAVGPTATAEDGATVGTGREEKTVKQELLDKLTITVEAENDRVFILEQPVSKVMYENEEWFYIGKLSPGKSTPLKITLEVPVTMGNEFRDVAGYVDWQFKIEVQDKDKTPPVTPDTGDNTNTLLYAAILGGSAAALIVLLVLKRKKRDK